MYIVGRPKYILGLEPCSRKHSGSIIDQELHEQAMAIKAGRGRPREVGRGGVSPPLNKEGVRK